MSQRYQRYRSGTGCQTACRELKVWGICIARDPLEDGSAHSRGQPESQRASMIHASLVAGGEREGGVWGVGGGRHRSCPTYQLEAMLVPLRDIDIGERTVPVRRMEEHEQGGNDLDGRELGVLTVGAEGTDSSLDQGRRTCQGEREGPDARGVQSSARGWRQPGSGRQLRQGSCPIIPHVRPGVNWGGEWRSATPG